MKLIIILFYISTTYASGFSWIHKSYFPIYKIERSLKDYYQDCGSFPTESEGLDEFLYSEKECWKGPYLFENNLIDNISQQRFQYFINQGEYEILSVGYDGIINTEDDFNSTDSEDEKQKNIYLYTSKENFDSFIKKIVFITLGFLILVLMKSRKLVVSTFLSVFKLK